MCIYASFLNKYFSRSCELISDIIFHSNFPEKEIEKEKEIIYDEIHSYLDSPSEKIYDDFESYFFSNHPLGYNVLGEKKSILSFKKQDLLNYVEKHFRSKRMVYSYAGSISIQKVINELEKNIIQIENNLTEIDVPLFSNYVPFKIKSNEAQNQAHGVIGGVAPGYRNDD